MIKKSSLVAFGGSLLLAATLPLAAAAQDESKTFYWISHGDPADPVWTYFLDGANQWASDTGQTVNTSFHSNDVASAAGGHSFCHRRRRGRHRHHQPRPGQPRRADGGGPRGRHPHHQHQHARPDRSASMPMWAPTTWIVGQRWAQFLVDGGYVSEGDFVWMPVEVPGATYGVDEERGIASVFEPLGITWEVTDATYEQATVIDEMVNYLTANKDNIDAMIGLGDLVTGCGRTCLGPGRRGRG